MEVYVCVAGNDDEDAATDDEGFQNGERCGDYESVVGEWNASFCSPNRSRTEFQNIDEDEWVQRRGKRWPLFECWWMFMFIVVANFIPSSRSSGLKCRIFAMWSKYIFIFNFPFSVCEHTISAYL